MWNWFGGRAAKKDTAKEAIVNLRTHIDLLYKKEKHLETLIAESEAKARANVTKNKAVAKQALKRKRTLQTQLDKHQDQIDSLEQQLNAIENANLNLETVKVMTDGATAIKKIHGNLNIDKVDETMDNIREQVAMSEEISDAISRPLGTDLVDEDELEDELDALEQEALDDKMINAGHVPADKLPSVGEPSRLPSHKNQPIEEDDDEEELRKLQESLAM